MILQVITLAALLVGGTLEAQTRTYGQVWFKNGGADLYRDSLGLRVQIGSGTDARRTTVLRIPPPVALGIALALDGQLPAKDTLPIGPYNGVTVRCASAGCWLTMTTPGLASYFRPSPNIPASRLPEIRAALVNALQGSDVPAVVIDLR